MEQRMRRFWHIVKQHMAKVQEEQSHICHGADPHDGVQISGQIAQTLWNRGKAWATEWLPSAAAGTQTWDQSIPCQPQVLERASGPTSPCIRSHLERPEAAHGTPGRAAHHWPKAGDPGIGAQTPGCLFSRPGANSPGHPWHCHNTATEGPPGTVPYSRTLKAGHSGRGPEDTQGRSYWKV